MVGKVMVGLGEALFPHLPLEEATALVEELVKFAGKQDDEVSPEELERYIEIRLELQRANVSREP